MLINSNIFVDLAIIEAIEIFEIIKFLPQKLIWKI